VDASTPQTLLVGSTCGPLAAVSCLYRDTGVRMFGRRAFSVAGPAAWNSLAYTRLSSRSVGHVLSTVFSKRQRITLRLLYAMSRPSVVCLSVVCLSVCDVGAPYSGG